MIALITLFPLLYYHCSVKLQFFVSQKCPPLSLSFSQIILHFSLTLYNSSLLVLPYLFLAVEFQFHKSCYSLMLSNKFSNVASKSRFMPSSSSILSCNCKISSFLFL